MHPLTMMTAEKRARPTDADDDAASEWMPDVKVSYAKSAAWRCQRDSALNG
jgi:hypothetical protein